MDKDRREIKAKIHENGLKPFGNNFYWSLGNVGPVGLTGDKGDTGLPGPQGTKGERFHHIFEAFISFEI